MRKPERIPIIIEALKDNENKEKVLKQLFKENEVNIHYAVLRWDNYYTHFSELLTSSPDLRITQALVNTGVISNIPGSWYYTDDEPLMVNSEVLRCRDIYFWGKNFDKDGKALTKTEFILIKNMEDSHIKSIIRDNEEGLLRTSKLYLEMFYQELKERENYNKKQQ